MSSSLLGDTSMISTMTALPASVFNGTERYLRVWFGTDGGSYTLLSPDQQFTAVPYALQAQEAADADTVDGFHASQLETHYQNVLHLFKSNINRRYLFITYTIRIITELL